jgi:hypothetical protein
VLHVGIQGVGKRDHVLAETENAIVVSSGNLLLAILFIERGLIEEAGVE